MKKIILPLLVAALVFGYTNIEASAHNDNKGWSTYSHRYWWGYMAYIKHTDVHKMQKRLKLVGTIGEKAAGTAVVWIPSVPAKVIGTVLIWGTGSGDYAANYIGKKDKGKGIKVRILKPNVYGWSPTGGQYLITGIYSR